MGWGDEGRETATAARCRATGGDRVRACTQCVARSTEAVAHFWNWVRASAACCRSSKDSGVTSYPEGDTLRSGTSPAPPPTHTGGRPSAHTASASMEAVWCTGHHATNANAWQTSVAPASTTTSLNFHCDSGTLRPPPARPSARTCAGAPALRRFAGLASHPAGLVTAKQVCKAAQQVGGCEAQLAGAVWDDGRAMDALCACAQPGRGTGVRRPACIQNHHVNANRFDTKRVSPSLQPCVVLLAYAPGCEHRGGFLEQQGTHSSARPAACTCVSTTRLSSQCIGLIPWQLREMYVTLWTQRKALPGGMMHRWTAKTSTHSHAHKSVW